MEYFSKMFIEILLYLLFFLLNENVTVVAQTEDNSLVLTPSLPTIHFVDDSFIIFCKSRNNKMETQWKDPKGNLQNITKGRIHIEEKSGLLALVFEHIALEDKGNWSCDGIIDGSRVIRKTFELLINQKISFGKTELVQSAREGRDATVNCYATGDPRPQVYWLFNGESINTVASMKYKSLSNGLFIKNVTQADAGEYTCRAMQITPMFSDSDKITILLRIQHQPHWFANDTLQSTQFVYINGSVNITCAAMGEPPPSFTWVHDGKAITAPNYRIFVAGYASTLQIHVMNESNFGDYKCKVANSMGTLERIIKLQKGSKPPTPNRFQLKRIFGDGFELDIRSLENSKTNESMSTFAYRIEYMTDDDFKYIAGNWSFAKRKEFSLHQGFRFIIRGLESNTTYLMRAASINVAGPSDWTAVKKFTTSNLARRLASELSIVTIAIFIFITNTLIGI